MKDTINDLKQGQPITNEQKAALAKENIQLSNDAHKLAADHIARDAEAGNVAPPERKLADIIKDKVVNQEFQENNRPITNKPE